ncbi:small integral membrane protein 14 isoform X2 [Anser cygnoides]|uniref:small integral membrane protein 14 isoform X2 n=1 Tax=Anser cygnoides TaxID=8845 RepID=UPI0034D15FB8
MLAISAAGTPPPPPPSRAQRAPPPPPLPLDNSRPHQNGGGAEHARCGARLRRRRRSGGAAGPAPRLGCADVSSHSTRGTHGPQQALEQNQTLQATDVTLSGKQEQDTSNHPCRSKIVWACWTCCKYRTTSMCMAHLSETMDSPQPQHTA